MNNVTIIGIDLAKSVFQVHGAGSDGSVVYRKKLSRPQFSKFMADQPACIVGMEACGSAYFWAQMMEDLGHEVRLVPPIYVKPFVKRQKNDSADAEAIAEAASRSNMRFVPIKSVQQQSRSIMFRTREMLTGQRTQTVNALRSHLAEFGVTVPKGVHNLKRLAAYVECADENIPIEVVQIGEVYLEQIAQHTDRIKVLEKTIKGLAETSETSRRLRTVPGVGPITAMAIEAFAPEMERFEKGRNFSASLGLVPRQHSTGGKQVLGRTSKMGQKDIRKLLIDGAMSVIKAAIYKEDESNPSWLGQLLERKPRMVVAVALANKMARAIWAMLTKGEDYRNPATVAVA
ncbi:IS110 family transposase [Roseobacter litoralis]|uniref:IS110 family transposase n=1 Tax=Roseobacter litoralis TaxID=42443 RepID=UPI0024938D61|nr:IS110 family transposase [Roseobacter litoralis]